MLPACSSFFVAEDKQSQLILPGFVSQTCILYRSTLLPQAVLVTSLDVECPCLGDFDLGLSSPVVTSTRLSSGFRGCISSSLLPMPIGQKLVGDLLRSTFRSSLLDQAVILFTPVSLPR